MDAPIPQTSPTLTFPFFKRTGLQANMPQTSLGTVPTTGMYRVMMSTCVTQPASGGTPSSTMPNTLISWTDGDSGGTPSANIGGTSTGNTLNTGGQGMIDIYAKAGTSINVQTQSYASAGTTPMQYAVRYTVEPIVNG